MPERTRHRRSRSSSRRRRRPELVDHGDHRLLVGGPVPPQADAITLGRTIIVRREHADNPSLLAHERVHVRQFRELGWARFVSRYLGSYVALRFRGHGHMAAYRRLPLEIEASWVSRRPQPAAVVEGAGASSTVSGRDSSNEMISSSSTRS